ncbi:TPA: hypothetical protein ACT96X_000010 [Legionella pneumophila]|uniref:hypothetical protein n=1 Tax=Legionella pneumophila TaxID=446 RepID=UPI000B1843E2|nr:hypothetical protein [Legionella pneumophila]HAU1190625.1 hypothetical protein [Legionella pneumophila]HBD7100626.1 hypothetical protein [Legionella pneumophila]HCO4737566.1 hypothetical protein [Legionella pneumophila]HEG4431328.1 hypothetical protein [Legionella pneumophila]HEN5662514.1 hypothetical protein [Legionella pneumophila]
MMDQILNFFNSPFMTIVGGFSTLILIISAIYTLWCILIGVIPVWIRLGKGLSKSTIAIFSETQYSSLKNMIVDSKIFKEKNIMHVTKQDLKKAASASIFLVHWKDFQSDMHNILALKKDNTALIIYAPQNEGRIEDQELLNKIDRERNSVLVNFRGRLMNDILTSLITVNYEQR